MYMVLYPDDVVYDLAEAHLTHLPFCIMVFLSCSAVDGLMLTMCKQSISWYVMHKYQVSLFCCV